MTQSPRESWRLPKQANLLPPGSGYENTRGFILLSELSPPNPATRSFNVQEPILVMRVKGRYIKKDVPLFFDIPAFYSITWFFGS
jgi:hypothetical protein